MLCEGYKAEILFDLWELKKVIAIILYFHIESLLMPLKLTDVLKLSCEVEFVSLCT